MKNRRTKRIAAREFKAKCLSLISEVESRKREIVISQRGKPVAKLVPYDDKPKSLFGCMKGSVMFYGNIIDPIGDNWEAST